MTKTLAQYDVNHSITESSQHSKLYSIATMTRISQYILLL